MGPRRPTGAGPGPGGGLPGSDSQGDYLQDGVMKPPHSSASKAEALASALIQEEAQGKKKPFSKSPLAYVMAVVAGAIVAPTGLIVSPVVLLLSNLKGEYTTIKGQKITPLASWIGAGVVLTPLCWVANQAMFSKPSPPKAAITEISLAPVQFGTGDDAAAWLSRCAPPESDTTTAYDNPRPAIVTRFLSYPSKSVRIILVANGPMGSPPPYSSWRLMGVTDPGNNQPIEPNEALRRMGNSCRRG